MRGLAEWYGVSLVLHLAVLGLVVFFSAQRVRHSKPVYIDLSLETRRLPTTASVPRPTPVAASGATKRPVPVPKTDIMQAPDLVPQSTSRELPQPVAAPAVRTDNGEPHLPALPAGQARTGSAPPAARSAGDATAVEPSVTGDKGLQFAEKARKHYLREHFAYIRDLIMKQLVYPQQARRMHWSGKVTLSFIVGEDGSVSGIRVVESSGHTLLDRSAMETVRKAAPFPKPPVSAEIVVPVYYALM